MASFDFITDEKFRASLESDYREIEAALEATAWKAVHVLAGSIIEAVLADYLRDIGYYEEQRALNSKAHDATIDPLKMSLGALIEACKAKAILPEETAVLSTVVRSYRNLIHPGRVYRLEKSVDKNTATVAKSLVEMIVDKVSSKRQETFGLTAVQVVKKVVQDPDAVVFIDHLLRDMKPSELERLLLHEIPDTYLHNLNYARLVTHDYASVNTLIPTFRAAFKGATDEAKTKVVRRFVSILKEESQQVVADYEDAFFTASDLEYLPAEEVSNGVSLVKEHLFIRLERDTIPPYTVVGWITKLGRYIDTESEARRLAQSLTQQLVTQYQDISSVDAGITWDRLASDMKSRPQVYAVFEKTLKSLIEWHKDQAEREQIFDQVEWLDAALSGY